MENDEKIYRADDYVPQPADRGGMENKEGYTYGELKKKPVFDEIFGLIKNPTFKKWAEECNERNKNNPVGVVGLNGSETVPDLDALRIGPKIPLPNMFKMICLLIGQGHIRAVLTGKVEGGMIRAINYRIVYKKISALTGLTIEELEGGAIGNQLCSTIHEDSRDYAAITLNWGHKEHKHSGYCSKMINKINALAQKLRIIVPIVGLILLLILLFFLLRGCGKENNVVVEQPAPAVQTEQPAPKAKEFDWSKAVIVNAPLSQTAPIATADELRQAIDEGVRAALASDTDTLRISTLTGAFDFGAAAVNEVPAALGKEIASLYLRTSQKQRIIIQGYGCNIGDNAANDYVSNNRAEAVKAALVAEGVDESKIATQSYGKRKNSEFAASNNAELRRVLITFE